MRAGEDPGASMTTTPALVAHRTPGVRRAVAVALGVLALLLAIGCSGPTPQPKPSASSVDWQALGAAVETAIQGDTQGLDNIRAVVVSVDGKTQLEHYRNGFSADDHEHVWSVTKSVVATLIGIAIDDGLIPSVDQPLSVLLPEHRKAMTPTTSRVTLRQLMSMSGGFAEEDWSLVLYERDHVDDDDFIDYLLKLGPRHEPGKSFEYSNTSAHLAAAVLASALARSSDPPKQTLLDYARANLFEPLGIRTDPAYTGNITLSLTGGLRQGGLRLADRPQQPPLRRLRTKTHRHRHDQDRRALPKQRAMAWRPGHPPRVGTAGSCTIEAEQGIRAAVVDHHRPRLHTRLRRIRSLRTGDLGLAVSSRRHRLPHSQPT